MNHIYSVVDFIENETLLKSIKTKAYTQEFETNASRYEGYPLDFVKDTRGLLSALLTIIPFIDKLDNKQELLDSIKKLQRESSKIRDPGMFMRYTLTTVTPTEGVDILESLRDLLKEHLDQIKVRGCEQAFKEYYDHILKAADSRNPIIYQEKKEVLDGLQTKLSATSDYKTRLQDIRGFMSENNDKNTGILRLSRDGNFKAFIKFILKLVSANTLIDKLDNKTVTGRFFCDKIDRLTSDAVNSENSPLP